MAILKFSASAVAAQIAHARACKTFLPNWNGPVDRPALILIVGHHPGVTQLQVAVAVAGVGNFRVGIAP